MIEISFANYEDSKNTTASVTTAKKKRRLTELIQILKTGFKNKNLKIQLNLKLWDLMNLNWPKTEFKYCIFHANCQLGSSTVGGCQRRRSITLSYISLAVLLLKRFYY